MQTSILWEGSLPSKEEMEKMKQEGYLFRAVEGGWKICLKLHNTPTGTWYADNFSKSFLKEVELHQYLEEVEKRATWFEVPSKELRVYEAGQILEKPESKEERICMEVLRDTKNHRCGIVQCRACGTCGNPESVFESRKRESIAPCFRRKGSGSAFSRKKRVSGISLTGGFYACQCLHTWRV